MRSATTGKFERVHQLWTPETWDNGWLDNRGRFRVFRPDYPRAYAQGMALRYHVVWWLVTGAVHPEGTNLHHINHVKTDDRFENLMLLKHGEHSRMHNFHPHEFVCVHCGDTFVLGKDAVTKRRREGNEPKFCSQRCYHAHPKSNETRLRTSASMMRAWEEGRK